MEVTCERCSTVYDFDDALVSERGTTVKCTTCGHQFKVRRQGTGSVPEQWIVRTVDGRELSFSALRELQAAIHESKVTRDDVLSRGNSRPRRLGSIAELDPFFNRIGMTVPGSGTTPPPPAARTRTRTPTGLGTPSTPPPPTTASTPPPPRTTETSVVFTLPGRAAAPAPEPTPAPPPARRPASVPPPPPVEVGRARTPSVRPPPAAPSPRPDAGLAVPGAPRLPSGLEDLTSIDAPTVGLGIDRMRPVTPPPPAALPMFPPPETPEPPPPASGRGAALANAGPSSTRTPRASGPMFPPPESDPPPPPPQALRAPPPPASTLRDRMASNPDMSRERFSSTPDVRERLASNPDVRERMPSSPSLDAGPISSRERPPASSGRPSLSGPASGDGRPSFQTHDEALSEPRFSGGAPSRRTGAARWLVGILLVGVTLFGAVTLGRKYLPGATTQGAPGEGDARLGALLEQGDRDLREGDLEAAKEAFDKASALADKDLRVAARLAHLAAVRADIPWLKLRLLPDGDPDQVNARRELDLAVTRARQAAEQAQALGPNDPLVTRCRIDVLRLAGDLDGARKLVSSLPKTGAPPEGDDVLLAALDLAEASPVWATVIERLRAAARAEQNLGRARAMLIYALVRSGDVTGAKTEYERLAALPRPHPLTPSLRAFLGRTGGDAKKPDGDTSAPPADDEAFKLADEAKQKGDLARAASLLEDLLKRRPNDPKVLTELGAVAMQKRDRPSALRHYEQALAADKTYMPAMAGLADLKWDNGERKTASSLYRQIIERGGDGSPYAARAKERLTIFANTYEDEPTPSGGPIDRSDLPGGNAPPANTVPPGVDTSDLPGKKP
jgi:predicted Zn finger-like uncharacterized protein